MPINNKNNIKNDTKKGSKKSSKKGSKKSSKTVLKREIKRVESDVVEEVKEVKQENKESFYNYSLIQVEIPEPKEDIFDFEPNPKYSSNIEFPRFNLGFQHFNHQSKDKMMVLNQFEGKKKVYLVLNPFERYVDNYQEDIGKTSQKYFNLPVAK